LFKLSQTEMICKTTCSGVYSSSIACNSCCAANCTIHHYIWFLVSWWPSCLFYWWS